MQLMVPTVMAECLVVDPIEYDGKTIKAGEIMTLPYGQALLLRAMGKIGAFKDETDKHLEAAEMLGVYGGDCWFPHRLQTIRHVGEYLAAQNAQYQRPN